MEPALHADVAPLEFLLGTWRGEGDGRPLHGEMGYLRAEPGGDLELVIAHPTGVVEIELGSVVDRTVELASLNVKRTPTAKDVMRLERSIRVDDDGALRYELRMAAMGVELAPHLRAELRRADA